MSEDTTPTQTAKTKKAKRDEAEDRSPKAWAERRGAGEGPDYTGLAQRVPMDPHRSNA